MTASKPRVKLLVAPLIRWMREGGGPWAANLASWNTRRELMGTGETFNVNEEIRTFVADPKGRIDKGGAEPQVTAALIPILRDRSACVMQQRSSGLNPLANRAPIVVVRYRNPSLPSQ